MMAASIGTEEERTANICPEDHDDSISIESSFSNYGSTTNGSVVTEESSATSFNGMLMLNEEDKEYILLKHRFNSSIGTLAQHCTVVAAYRNMHSSPMGRARFEASRVFMRAMAEKCGGNPNVKHGWYGTTKDRVHQIMNSGFSVRGMSVDGCDSGLFLFPESSAIDSVLSSPVDGNGLRHLLVCRVILGNTEEVLPSSRQFGPSSEKFDSGVDNQQSPTKYVVWYPHVNTHILPLYYLSVKLNFRTRGIHNVPMVRPSSPWIPMSALMSVLSKTLPPSTTCLIKRAHSEFMERKITRQQLIHRLRQLSGDKLLIYAIKKFRHKKLQGALHRKEKA